MKYCFSKAWCILSTYAKWCVKGIHFFRRSIIL